MLPSLLLLEMPSECATANLRSRASGYGRNKAGYQQSGRALSHRTKTGWNASNTISSLTALISPSPPGALSGATENTGDYIPESIQTTTSMGISLNRGRWSVGARGRYFGPRPLVEDNSVRSASSFLVNLKVGYQDMKNHRVFAEVLNVFGKRANDFVVVWSF